MILRRNHLGKLKESAEAQFEQRMVDHLRTHFPFQTRLWGDDLALQIVRHARERAGVYGFTTQREICLYLTLLPSLGGRFDEDPMLPWATSVLHDTSIRESTIRIERLVARAQDYLDATLGKENEHMRQWAHTIRSSWQHLLTRATQVDPQTGIVFLLERTCPQKWAKAPLQLLPQFVAAGIRRAESYEIRSAPGVILYLAFAFLFGWKFDQDPLLPMFTSILRQGAGAQVPKERQLYDRLLNLADVIANPDRSHA